MESATLHTTLTVEVKTLQVGVNQRGFYVMESAPLHTTLTVEAKTFQVGVN